MAFGIPCIFYKLTSFPCPTCYMTRALLALLRGDTALYFDYNAMALPVASVFILELFGKAWGKYRYILHVYSVFVLVLNLVYYINRF